MKITRTIIDNRRPLLMLLSMTLGITLHAPLATFDSATGHVSTPALIAMMLFVTFCRVHIRDLKFSRMHLYLILFQMVATPISYFALLPFGEIVAQGAMICFLAPVAMAAVAIGALLGGSVISMVAYTLLCNTVIALAAPYFLDIFGNGECTFVEILTRVAPLLIAPLMAAQLLKLTWRRAADWLAAHGQISFYMWLCSMAITLGRTTGFIIEVQESFSLSIGVALALVALLACLAQYILGNRIGRLFGDNVAATQSLGQKNTILAVWLAQSFLNPISSIAPTAYIIWQNLVNSIQIMLHDRRERKKTLSRQGENCPARAAAGCSPRS